MNKFAALISIQIYCAVLLFVVICNVDAELSEAKRFSKEQGLMAFPRVGRRETAMKFAKLRHELFAFPRTGRSGPSASALGLKRSGGTKTMNTGLWFGPRLGRVQKRNLYAFAPDIDTDIDDYYNPADGRQVLSLPVRYTPRLGRESDEELEQLGQPLLEDS